MHVCVGGGRRMSMRLLFDLCSEVLEWREILDVSDFKIARKRFFLSVKILFLKTSVCV